ncbi:MAG TPA: hypothetical protein VGA33_04250, partial [Thermoanaerobaculia bacterium]
MNIETREGLFAVMEQIAAEREAARPIVEKLVASGEPVEDIEIPEGWRTAGMVMELCDFAFSRLENDPLQSLAFAHVALAIAGNLGADMYSSTLRAYVEGRAWKEVGYGHRYLDRHDASIPAFQTSETVFSEEGALLHEANISRYLRAGELCEVAKHAEALALNQATTEVFRDVNDIDRLVRCDILEAVIEFRKGALESARKKFEAILNRSRDSVDLYTLGYAYNGLGQTYRVLGRTNDAIMALESARRIFSNLDMPAEINRTDWGEALILLES